MTRRDPAFVVLPAAAVLTRIPAMPRTLSDFDAAAFAEAIRGFDPIRFHPHPPGYAFYVLAGKLVATFGPTPERALAWLSVAGSAATAAALYAFGRALANRTVGWIAVMLFLASPLAWTYGSTQGTYGFGALGAILVGYGAWQRLSGRALHAGLLGFLAGIAAGFRPDTAVVVTPLLVVATALAPSIHGLERPRALLEAALGGTLGLALWMAPTISACGGWSAYHAAVVRQWEAVAFSNAESRFTWLLFRGVNVAKLCVYGAFALGPLGALLFAWASARTARDAAIEPATKVTLFAWILGYALLSGLVAFGQPGMLLTALPAVTLTIALALAGGSRPLPPRRSLAVATCAAAMCGAIFWWAPGLSERGFFDSHAALPAKVRTELELFTRPGLALVDRELGGRLAAIRRDFDPHDTLVLTNAASSTRAMYALPGYRVACYFAFAGFAAPMPSREVGEPRATWPLPPGSRWLVLLDVDRHGLAVDDQLALRLRLPAGGPSATLPSPSKAVHAVSLDGIGAIRFRNGSIELLPSATALPSRS